MDSSIESSPEAFGHLGETWLGHIFTGSGDEEFAVDTAKLLRYLLLFDRVIIHSSRLREFSILASDLGPTGLSALLKSGTIRVLCHALTTAQVGQSDIGGRNTPLPNGSYSFRAISTADRKDYLHGCFQNVKTNRELTYKQSIRLKGEIASILVDPVESVRKDTEDQLLSDLRCSVPHFVTALVLELRRDYGISVKPTDLTLDIHEFNERDFRVESNLHTLMTLDEFACHKVTERALLTVGGLNQRMAEMNGYSAMTDFWYRDLSLLDKKLRYLAHIAPEERDRALATVLALPGLPDVAQAVSEGRFDIERFLEIRDSEDGREFRRRFRGRGPDDIALLTDRWEGLRSKLGAWIGTPRGKMVRFLVSTGAGLIPVAGLAAGAVDSFWLEKWLPRSQPLAFLQHSYRSVFRASNEDVKGSVLEG